MSGPLELQGGSRVAVVGGGPAGAFFTIFALQMACMVDKDLEITIYDPKDFTREGAAGCNRCGGVISELMLQMLAVEGINLPETVIQRGIDSYRLHTARGSVSIETPSQEHSIATVYRGGGPKGLVGREKESFDGFLLDLAVQKGARHLPLKVDRVETGGGLPRLYGGGELLQEADLVIGAFGVNSPSAGIFASRGFGYRPPRTMKAAIAEIGCDETVISEHFGSSIHLFLLPGKGVKFAALIPKKTYLTLCILGREMSRSGVDSFLSHPVVQKALPPSLPFEPACRCLPKMNVGAPPAAFDDRIAVIGDAGATRLFKDGIGAAYTMGKAAATTAVFHGISRRDFGRVFHPAHRSLRVDNWFGRYLFFVTDLYKKYGFMTSGMLKVVEEEQKNQSSGKRLSWILWNLFTGNERYRTVFGKAIDLPMHIDLWQEFARIITGKEP